MLPVLSQFYHFEDSEFIAKLSALPSWFTFLEEVQNNELIKEAIYNVKTDQHTLEYLQTRIISLALNPGSGTYEHKWDIPIAIYLYILGKTDKKLAKEAAIYIHKTCSSCWWASAMAVKLLTKLSVIKKNASPNICGGAARISFTFIPVWTIISLLQQGATEEEILHNFPVLMDWDIEAAKTYYETHKEEIDLDLLDQDSE